MIDFNLVKKIIARLTLIFDLIKKDEGFEASSYTDIDDIAFYIQRIYNVVFSGRGEELPSHEEMLSIYDVFNPEVIKTAGDESRRIILKDIVAYCLVDIEKLRGLTKGEENLFGNIAEALQNLNGILFEKNYFYNGIVLEIGEMQEEAWQRLMDYNAEFEKKHPRDEIGRFIDKEVNRHIEFVRSKEENITKDVTSVAEKNNVENIGLEFRVKTKSSASDKARRDVKEKGGTQSEAAKDFSDLIRYTQGGTPDNLVEKGFQSLKLLQEKGYKIRKVKNFWLDADNPYNGVNVQLESPEPDSVRLEIQFNTQHNVNVKEKMHKYYEEARKGKTKEEEEALKKLMHEKFDDKWEPIKNIENFVFGNF